MAKLPYFKWYPSDAHSDAFYTSLSDAELGFYHRCLNMAWTNGFLPSDPEALASLMHVSLKYLEKIWKKVSGGFQLTQDGRLVNHRQEVERSKAVDKSLKATAAIQIRYGRSTDVCLRAYESVSSKEVIPVEQENPEVYLGEKVERMPPDFDEQWLEFKTLYGNAKEDSLPEDFTDAWHKWKTMDFFMRTEAIRMLKAWMAAGKDFWCLPARFLQVDYRRPLVDRKPARRDPGPPPPQWDEEELRSRERQRRAVAAERAAGIQ